MAVLLQVDADTVLFNFECCSDFSQRGFSQGEFSQRSGLSGLPPVSLPEGEDEGKDWNELAVRFIAYCLARGNMVMCSDFSLKALI